MRIIGARATAAALPFHRLIEALRALFASGCVVPQRHVHQPADAMTSLIMPAWVPGGPYAVKIVNIAPGNAAQGLPSLHSTVLLHDGATGKPLALMDGDTITARRTAAASALAASYLARQDARHLLVVGAGRVAALLPEAYAAVRPIDRVSVWARRPEAATALARRWRRQGFDARAVTSLEQAAAEADVISCATLSTEPVVKGKWLRAGNHLDLIGSFMPAMREADDDCFRGSGLYIDTDEALAKSGDLLGPMSCGILDRHSVQGTLASLCQGQTPGRRDALRRTVFKSVGSALEDLAAAVLVADKSF
ncbi:MAG: ornithine cyclodeaminase family protein [Betaproteobacteria bacterium]|nr:ornithine cyclodeaminase family protein [Betaproteobacteria bacterium]